MDNKKIWVIIVVGLLVAGGFGILIFGNGGDTPTGNVVKNIDRQQGESYDEMTARMHPNQQRNNDMPSGGNPNTQQPGESYDEMMARMHPNQQNNNDMSSHHGGGVQTNSDRINTGIDKISFSSAIGQKAPDFTLTKPAGSKFTLSDYKDKTVVLFCNEGAMCYPACWDQMASLGSDERFNKDNIIAASIVIDGREKWDRILRSQPKYGAGIILFDTNAAVSQAYDILNLPSSMHKGSFPGHTYIIIKNGIISYVLDDPNMALNNDNLALKI